MLIYRIEDNKGYGYKGKRDCMDYPDLDNLSRCHKSYKTSSYFCDLSRPLPWHDNIPKSFLKRDGWYFGFYTEHQITRYFSPYDLFLMGYFGGVVVTYEVDDNLVWKGNNQCVFFKERAIKIDSKSCSEYSYVKELGEWVDYDDIKDSLSDIINFKNMENM